MPYLTIYVEERLEKTVPNLDMANIEESIIKILKTELMARQENCQLIWIPSRIYTSNYKVFGELKFRANKYRHREKQEKCLHKIGEILQKLFKVKIRLRSFSIENITIAALDL